MKVERNQTVTNCHGLKILSPEGKMRKIDEKVVHVISNGERNLQMDANIKDSYVVTLLRMTSFKYFKQSINIC